MALSVIWFKQEGRDNNMANYPTLSTAPSYPIVEQRSDPTIKSEFDSGYMQTRPRYTRKKMVFNVNYDDIPNSDKGTLETFVDTVRGGADYFNWTHPLTSTVYSVRFKETPQFELKLLNRWAVSFVLEQV